MATKTDVIVVGGGISGCATAYNLAKRGAHVILLEKGQIADEASGRTWGGLSAARAVRPQRFPWPSRA